MLSGTWRQQFDWAVVEWNRDNVFEHPLFRNLPDGDLSGLQLTYEEERENCIPIDSDLYATVDWPSLRIWAGGDGAEHLYKVPLQSYATPVEGEYVCASLTFALSGSIAAGEYVGISFLDEHHTYQIYAVDTVQTIVQAIADSVNTFSKAMKAQITGPSISLFYTGGQSIATAKTGVNGNRIGAYAYVTGSSLAWDKQWGRLQGGTSPSRWRIALDFSSITDQNGIAVPTTQVRKMRWTYAADLQYGEFVRSEFAVRVRNWSVSGSRLGYSVAGPGSRRIEDDSSEVAYTGTWSKSAGNFSGGTIHQTTEHGASLRIQYSSPLAHTLYVGTRAAFNAGTVNIQVDSQPVAVHDLFLAGEDALCRVNAGLIAAGSHTVTITNTADAGKYFYFDFIELAQVAQTLPSLAVEAHTTLATDWDTDHSIALPAERTAWMIQSLGFSGRINHYAGALWFYEMVLKGHQYGRVTVTIGGDAVPNTVIAVQIAPLQNPDPATVIQHLVHVGDTLTTVAKALELKLNSGYTGLRAESSENVLTIYSRELGAAGNGFSITATSTSMQMTPICSGPTFAGGADGMWVTDVTATPRLNRAARDWSRSFFQALRGYGLDSTAAFSMELQHGDTSIEAGIAQRYPSGSAVMLDTPAVQTNFSPATADYYQQVYLDMAIVMQKAGVQPYLQFGEVQWWYFPYDKTGMPFYDAYTQTRFQQQYGRAMSIIPDGSVAPQSYPEEAEFLPRLIGEFTDTVMAYVRQHVPTCRFEVLYPVDVNDGAFNAVINFPNASWTPSKLDCLKTESFTYTYARNLDLCRVSIAYPAKLAFPPSKRSHLIGISDPIAPWRKEVNLSESEGVESVVLFALDQFCLIGYSLPIQPGSRTSTMQG